MHAISTVLGFAIAAAIAYWVYQDAEKRGMNGGLWAAGAFFVCIIFLPLYLIMRKPVIRSDEPPPAF